MASKESTKSSSKDGGWAWMVCAAITLHNVIVAGTLKSLGILFLQFSDGLEDDPAKIAWIGTTFTLCVTVIGPVTGRLEDELSQEGLRILVVIFSFIAVLGFAAAAWCHQIYQVILTFGLISGLSLATLDPAVLSFIGIYFEEKRSLACGITFAGSSLGGVVFPPLLTWINGLTGFRGALMVLAGIWLHEFVIIGICRPLDHKEDLVVTKQDKKAPIVENGKQVKDEGETNIRTDSVGQLSSNNTGFDHYSYPASDSITCNNSTHLYRGQESASVERAIPESNFANISEEDAGSIQTLDTASPAKRFLKELIEYFKYICRPTILLLMITFALAAFTEGCSYFLLPLLADELGLDEVFSSRIIMIASVAAVVTKPIFGLITNRLGEKKVYMLHVSFIITAAFGLLLLLHMKSVTFYIYAVALGAFGGLYMQFVIPMLMEFSEESNVSRVAGLFPLVIGLGPTIGQPLLSRLNDISGTHKIGLILLIAIAFLAAVVLTVWTARKTERGKRKSIYEISGTVNAAFEGQLEISSISVTEGIKL